MAEDEENESRGFKVHDRRRFSDSGETRQEEDAPGGDTQAPPPSDAAGAPSDTESTGHDSPQEAPTAADGGAHQAPEINFPTFVISLSTQALAHLGEIPDPVAGNVQIDLGAARQLIDILGMLKEKTVGNLDTDEETLLEHALYDLRMKYVERAQNG